MRKDNHQEYVSSFLLGFKKKIKNLDKWRLMQMINAKNNTKQKIPLIPLTSIFKQLWEICEKFCN